MVCRRTNQSKIALFAIAMSLTGMTCAAHDAAAPPGRQVVTVRRIDGPYVPAGTEFDAELEQTLAADSSRPGDAFVAQVGTPLRAANGDEVGPSGARARGRIADAVGAGGPAPAPR